MLAGTLTEIGAPPHEVMKPAKLFAELEPGRPEAVIPVAQYLRDTGDDAGSRRLLTGLIDRQMEAAARDEMGATASVSSIPTFSSLGSVSSLSSSTFSPR